MADLLKPPPGYQCPLGDEYLGMLNQAISLEQTHHYNLQQAGLCGLDMGKMQADADRRMQLFLALKAHFFPGCP
jgi:hypothetical protein